MTSVRHAWAQMVRKNHDLSMTARVVGQVLALDFANERTGQCNPKEKLLCTHLGVSGSTVKRALAELRKAGLLGDTTQTAPGISVSYTLIRQGDVAAFAPRQASDGGHIRPAPAAKTGVKSAENEGHFCNSPYKGKNQAKNKRARARDACPVDQAVVVGPGSHRECAWNDWLATRKFPTVAELGVRHSDQTSVGWRMPFVAPPRDDDEIESRITEKFLSWALGRMRQRRRV